MQNLGRISSKILNMKLFKVGQIPSQNCTFYRNAIYLKSHFAWDRIKLETCSKSFDFFKFSKILIFCIENNSNSSIKLEKIKNLKFLKIFKNTPEIKNLSHKFLDDIILYYLAKIWRLMLSLFRHNFLLFWATWTKNYPTLPFFA